MLAHIVSVIFLAFALSLDGFGVGVTYGLRKIRIPIVSIAIISFCSGVVIFISMQIGVLISRYVSSDYTNWIGAVILIGIGCWALIQLYLSQNKSCAEDAGPDAGSGNAGHGKPLLPSGKSTLWSLELKRFGLVVQILRTPSAADVDRSGSISASEAALLGIALSLDAFGAGLGAAMLGFSPLATSLVIAVASGSFIVIGMHIGFTFAGVKWMRRLSALPGCMLILIGILRLF
ncbi:putative sporulation protein YtaF [Paenibacillus sp. CECT 9249]|uniref:MntP/YtaF family protein n=1 Tax=Paenibacillus sp. CECT 9249 TaxID=2845385 RepID=UPI001E5C04C4|nr:MntP/YtaF family protein [Paenibacillus sp. CECT 9249]CAH0117721.1 putative sporulation protein YtaF [Paenibacillus sp. CECT 9249]